MRERRVADGIQALCEELTAIVKGSAQASKRDTAAHGCIDNAVLHTLGLELPDYGLPIELHGAVGLRHAASQDLLDSGNWKMPLSLNLVDRLAAAARTRARVDQRAPVSQPDGECFRGWKG